MKILVKTSIEGYANLTVHNSVTSILEDIASENTIMHLHIIHDNGEQGILLLQKENIISITIEFTPV